MGHTELANSNGTPARLASATTGAKVEDRLALSISTTLSCVMSFLALAVALPGSAESSCRMRLIFLPLTPPAALTPSM